MAESSYQDDQDEDRRHLLDTFHRYFLSRLGLISDEVDWPTTDEDNAATATAATAAAAVDDDGGSSASWRARDALTSILGSDASTVMSDSGLTTTEMALLAGNMLDAEGNGSSSKMIVPVDSIVPPLFGSGDNYHGYSNNDSGGGGGRENNDEPPALDVEVVRRTFDAAAHAIVRGDQRALMAGPTAASTSVDENVSGSKRNEFTHLSIMEAKGFAGIAEVGRCENSYEPPLLLAMESIRTSRITTLNEASASDSVPSFLKKNNTIPWFHVPVQQVTRGVSTVIMTSSSSAPVASAVGSSKIAGIAGSVGGNKLIHAGRSKVDSKAKKKEHEKISIKRGRQPDAVSSSSTTAGNEVLKKKRMKIQKSGEGAAALPANERDTTSVKASKKEKKDVHSKSKSDKAAKKLIKKASAASSSSKHTLSSPSSSSSKPKKMTRISSSTSSVIEDASTIGSNAKSSRAIISASAAGIFREFRPEHHHDDLDAVVTDDEKYNAVELEISKIAGGSGDNALFMSTNEKREDQQHLNPKKKSSSHSSKKSKEGDPKADMEEVVDQAKRIANRVLDHTKGAARRGDQRRKFRMDAALSRVGGRGGNVSSSTVPRKGLSIAMGGGEMTNRIGNPFLVRPAHTLPLIIPNPFVRMNPDSDFADSENSGFGAAKWGAEVSNNHYDQGLARGPAIAPWKKLGKNDAEWTESCVPRLLTILAKGAGHAVMHDMQWDDRSFRVANLLQNMAISRSSEQSSSSSSTHDGYRNNYGPHLVVTSSGEDFDKFERVFGGLGHGLMHTVVDKGEGSGSSRSAFVTNDPDDVLLRVLPYHGPKSRRRELRKHFGSLSPSPESHFSFLGGLEDSPFHVILTTYSELVEDYAHFCQIPFQAVVLDDGMSWLGCSHYDPHGKIGKVWNSGFWNNFDHGSGRAGVADGDQLSTWDFSKDIAGVVGDDKPASNASGSAEGRNRLGLTARHRILLASDMHAQYGGQVYKAPVLGLLSFLSPQFADAVKDGWERSKISSCKNSMSYIRTMLARLIVVYTGGFTACDTNDSMMLSLKALGGELPLRSLGKRDGLDDGVDKMIKSQKIVHSRKFAAAWFQSSIREELGITSLDSILATVKRVTTIGFTCEEVVTASSLTTSGAGGCVVGQSAYRAAVRCRKSFSSEQGLKQHIISAHAPPGTWLCRSCGDDCGTSQARTTHERSCGKPKGSTKSSLGGAAPSAGQGTAPTRGRKKKEVKNPVILEKQSAKKKDESIQVQGYKGVWALPNGTYLLKVNSKPLVDSQSEKETPLLFDTAEAAAKKFDEIVAEKGKKEEREINYTNDGSRVVHQDGAVKVSVTKSADVPVSAVSGTNPDLSVIDIKDLPPHVKPLLRDPSQTSRTGGNSKRYVYAYRGVCRQQRKGHDRWQSQISFNGTNHYLGTFDSEWDAAAVYAWAHLILYGEEATKKAQLEGEEAAAAFEQHEKDIAEGKIPPPSPSKPVKKKKRGAPKKNQPKADKSGKTLANKSKEDSKADILHESKCNNLAAGMPKSTHSKKKRPMSLQEWNKLKTECAMMLSSGTKGTSKATILATRKDIADMSEKLLLHNISDYISGNLSSISKSFLQSSQTPDSFQQLPARISSNRFVPPMLIGLSAIDVAWEVESFIEAYQYASACNAAACYSKLNNEFGTRSANISFRTFLLSPCCTLGRAPKGSRNMFLSSGHANNTLGMPVGNLDCNIGGPEYSCSEMAAKIQLLPSRYSKFQFMACNDDDVVTLNGQRMSAKRGALPLRDRDICSVGARVFVFIE